MFEVRRASYGVHRRVKAEGAAQENEKGAEKDAGRDGDTKRNGQGCKRYKDGIPAAGMQRLFFPPLLERERKKHHQTASTMPANKKQGRDVPRRRCKGKAAAANSTKTVQNPLAETMTRRQGQDYFQKYQSTAGRHVGVCSMLASSCGCPVREAMNDKEARCRVKK